VSLIIQRDGKGFTRQIWQGETSRICSTEIRRWILFAALRQSLSWVVDKGLI
jgi:hypothetical protein